MTEQPNHNTLEQIDIINTNFDTLKDELDQEAAVTFILPSDIDQKTINNNVRRSNWCFTIHNYIREAETVDDCKDRIKQFFNSLIASNKIQYYSVGFELGKEQRTPHLQGYVYTSTNHKKSFASVKKLLEPISLTPYLSYMYKRSTWMKCVNYTQKEHNFISNGTPPADHKDTHTVEITLSSIIEEVYTKGTSIKDLAARDPITRSITIKSRNTIERALHLYKERQSYYPPFVAWFSGETGTGKTSMANMLEEYLNEPVFEVTCDNGFFEGYNSEPYIYFDDYRSSPSDLTFQKLLSLTCEKNNMRVNVKGGSVPWRPRIIIFTSPNGIQDAIPIESQHSEQYNKKIKENFKQFKRRVHLSLRFNFSVNEGMYPGRNRIEHKIRTVGIPLFLQYYKYHCTKNNIPIIDCLTSVEPLQYDIDTYKDDEIRESDDINRIDHFVETHTY